MKTIALIGNPNCGKTTIFNALTGSRQHIGNWPGVTVEKKEGEATLAGDAAKVVDLPGVYSLTATSEDERVTLEYVLAQEAGLFVNVLDATALERNLYLTLLLCELHLPLVVVVTMMDRARRHDLEIDLEHLATHLGVSVIGVNANDAKDIRRLQAEIARTLAAPKTPTVRIEYGNELEREIDILAACTVKTAAALKTSARWVAVKALEDDPYIRRKLHAYHDLAAEIADAAIARVTKVLADAPDIELAEARYGTIAGLVRDVVHPARTKRFVSEIIDRFVLNRVFGIPIFLALMGAVFYLVAGVGGALTAPCERAGGFVFMRLPADLLAAAHAPAWLIAVIAQALGGALAVLVSFVPVVGFMFFALALLEDSGYMARAAFLMDRFMRWLGLPGKSFVPLLVGFGCSVPAILATRTLESKRDRLLTVFMIPFMSCSAKLPVYAAFAVVFAESAPGRMLLTLYLTGLALGILSALALKRTLFRGEPTHFIMELPPYHWPRPKHILLHTWENLAAFIFRAGRLIVPMMLLLGLMNLVHTDGRMATDGQRGDTVLAAVGKRLTPAFGPIGVGRDNYPAAVAAFSGLFAKESVIGTLSGLYAQEDPAATPAAAMRRHFPRGFHQAFAYLLFILLYVPCIGATAVVFREIGVRYGAIFVAYLTAFGWSVAALYHALAVSHRPLHFALALGTLAAIYTFAWLYGRHHRVEMS